MLIIGAFLAVLFFVYLLGAIMDKVNQRADELQLPLDGIKSRLYHLENK